MSLQSLLLMDRTPVSDIPFTSPSPRVGPGERWAGICYPPELDIPPLTWCVCRSNQQCLELVDTRLEWEVAGGGSVAPHRGRPAILDSAVVLSALP